MIDAEQLVAVLKKSGCETTPGSGDYHKSFEEIGLDSLDVYNFFTELEVELGLSISDEEFENLNSINDVLALLNARGQDS